MIIDEQHLSQVCQPGTDACCAYLIMGSEGFECAKITPLKQTIDLRLAEGTMRATGDNCPGYGEKSADPWKGYRGPSAATDEERTR